MPNHVTSVIKLSGDAKRIKAMLKTIQSKEYGIGSVDFEKILPMPDTVYNGPLGMRERELHGKNNWYDWRIANWVQNGTVMGIHLKLNLKTIS